MTTSIRSEATQSVVSVNGVDKFSIPSTGQVLPTSFSNLKASATGLNANVSVTADSVSLFDSAGGYAPVSSVNLTINTASTGVNGLDTGTIAASTWYSIWVIWNGTTVAGIASLSAASPIMPSGYTHKARIGWIRSDATVNKYPLSFVQAGRRVHYKLAAGSNITSHPVIASGSTGAVVTAASTVNFVPPTAGGIVVSIRAFAVSLSVFVGPSPAINAGDCYSYMNQAPQSYFNALMSTSFLLESTNIYFSSNAPECSVRALGWEDNI